MGLEHLPADLTIHDRVGKAMIRSCIERGDTVTFVYENEQRTVLVLEKTSRLLKGIAKERGGDYRNYLFSKIASIQYAKPFVKPVEVKTVKFEMVNYQPRLTCDSSAIIKITNKSGNVLQISIYRDGSANCFLNGMNYPGYHAILSHEPDRLGKLISEFTAE